MSLIRRAAAEGLGTALLLATIVGSGIMAERLAAGNTALALLANSIATGGGLFALILTFAPISGAHFNPLVTLSLAMTRQFAWREFPAYAGAQLCGAIAGVWATHPMFGEPVLQLSTQARAGTALAWSEAIASFGLLLVILIGVRQRTTSLAQAIAAYIVAAYWFTSSTSFANPAVTIARSLSDSFTGIAARDVPAFVLAQLAGATAAVLACRLLLPQGMPAADRTLQ